MGKNREKKDSQMKVLHAAFKVFYRSPAKNTLDLMLQNSRTRDTWLADWDTNGLAAPNAFFIPLRLLPKSSAALLV